MAAFGSLPILTRVNNPRIPLPWEVYGGADHTLKSLDCSSIAIESSTLEMVWGEAYRSAAVYQATQRALRAHAYQDSSKAIAEARAALQDSPLCAEAHVVLGMRSSSYEEALEHFRLAEEQGQQVLLPDRLEEAIIADNIWGQVPLRAWCRGVYGVANTLRKLGRYAEALKKFEELQEYNPAPQNYSSYFNFHALLPELWYRVHGPKECLRRARGHADGSETCTLESATVPWLFTIALANYAAGKAQGVTPTPPGHSASRTLQDALAGCAAVLAVTQNEHVAELLSGEKAMPRSGQLPMAMPQSDSFEQACLYVRDCRDMWEAVPRAVEFIAKMNNTLKAALELRKAVDDPRRPLDAALVERCIRWGVFPNAGLSVLYYTNSLLGAVTLLGGRPEAPQLARALLAAGARIAPAEGSGSPLTPMHMAMYYGAGPEVVRVLLEARADVLGGSHPGNAPLPMSCNQGNARELDAVLTAKPELCRPDRGPGRLPMGLPTVQSFSLLHYLFGHLLLTSCLACMNGGPKCMRCLHDRPHSPHASFTACVDVLVRHGLRRTPQFVAALKDVLRNWSDPGETRYMRVVIQHFFDAAAAAESGTTSSSVQAAGGGERSGAAQQEKQQQRRRRVCAECGKEGEGLKRCSRCLAAYYCDAACQKKAWPVHKQSCRAPAR